MARRRLSEQQTRRIRARRQRTDTATSGTERSGLVIAHYGRQVDVEAQDEAQDKTQDKTRSGAIVRCHLRANLEPLAAGDQVVWLAGEEDDAGVVVACLPRRSLLARPDSHSGIPKPVAANLDRLGIVIAPQPEPFANLIDRYLVAAESAGIAPFLVLNKCDLLAAGNRAGIDALLAEYRAIGYPVIAVSARRGEGLEALREQLRGHTVAFVGQSGVGKSSLVGALVPGLDIRIGALSEAEAKGRHTTTTSRLFHLPGCDLVDSPGIREFALDHLSRDDIERGFIELRAWLGRCRFRDCAHDREPGCAVREAEASGAISPARAASFRALLATASP